MFNFNANEDSSGKETLSPQFLSASHMSLFYQHLKLLSAYQQKSPEYQAVAFIMTSDDELYNKMAPYFGTDGFQSYTMFDEVDLSCSYAKLAKAAANLFGQDYETDLANLVYSLDHDLFHTLLQAMVIRKYGVDLA